MCLLVAPFHSSDLQEPAERTGAPYPQQVVQSGQGLDEHIGPLVGKLVTSSNEEEEGLLQVEVQVTVRQDRTLQPTLVSGSRLEQEGCEEHSPIEVSSDELLDVGFVGGVQVLELVHC